MRFEVIIDNGLGMRVARVLLRFDLFGGWRKYPNFGVWCYFLSSGNEVAVVDPGPYYMSLTGRVVGKKTGNTALILQVLEKHFAGKEVKEILITHYHHDHSQNAPDLQRELFEKQGWKPPIRIHADDLGEKRFLKVQKLSLEKMFDDTGINDWLLGEPLEEGEMIGDTGFEVVHAPGHTRGNVALLNRDLKLVIGGWWLTGAIKQPVRLIQTLIIDECPWMYPSSKAKFNNNYEVYFHHPVL